MQNDVISFNNEEFGNIRAVELDGQAWFVGKDVATALGYKDSVNALKSHVDDEDKKGWQITTLSRGDRNTTIINESGLYSLVLSSKLEGAKKFKKWVTSEVLPSIRKSGQYVAASAPAHPPEEVELRRKEIGLERARFLRSLVVSDDGLATLPVHKPYVQLGVKGGGYLFQFALFPLVSAKFVR